jgi:hypothetical protein
MLRVGQAGPEKLAGQNIPGDPGEFVGKCYRQHIVKQPLPGRLDPGLERVQTFGLISTTHPAYINRIRR